MNKMGKVFIISGPSGAGKTSIVKEALNRLQKEHNIDWVVTYTTRAKREDEVAGKDYVFISTEEFKKKAQENFFLETNEYAGHHYGSPRPSKMDLETGKSFFLVVDIEGAKRAIKEFSDALMVWVTPPDMDVLRDRLVKRGSESPSQVEKRFEIAKHELSEAHKIGIFDYVLVNDIFEQAVEEFLLLITQEL